MLVVFFSHVLISLASSPTSTPTQTPHSNSNGDELSIIGVVAGLFVVFALLGFLFFMYTKKKEEEGEIHSHQKAPVASEIPASSTGETQGWTKNPMKPKLVTDLEDGRVDSLEGIPRPSVTVSMSSAPQEAPPPPPGEDDIPRPSVTVSMSSAPPDAPPPPPGTNTVDANGDGDGDGDDHYGIDAETDVEEAVPQVPAAPTAEPLTPKKGGKGPVHKLKKMIGLAKSSSKSSPAPSESPAPFQQEL